MMTVSRFMIDNSVTSMDYSGALGSREAARYVTIRPRGLRSMGWLVSGGGTWRWMRIETGGKPGLHLGH
jgi:hypothetical protein